MITKKWNIGWGPVSTCNMNCSFCYSKTKRKNSSDLSLKEWINFIDENAHLVNTINFGTGENTLDSDWFSLIRHIRENYPEIRMSLTTNGHLSDVVSKNRDFYQSFIDAIDEVDVSLDFADEQKHNKFRGQPRAYSWALNTLKLCQDTGKRTTIVFLGSAENVSKDQIDGLFSIAAQYNTILRMNIYRPTDGINSFSSKFIMDYKAIVDALVYISEKYKIIALNDTLFSSILTTETVADPSGDLSIRILADGNITPSTYLIKNEHVIGNITESQILTTLEERMTENPVLGYHLPQECEGCVYSGTCGGGVYDRRMLWYGTLDRKDPYCPCIFLEYPDKKLVVTKENFESVHDGYLPTIFFKP